MIKNSVITLCLIVGAIGFSNPESKADAGIPRGKWIDVYQGGSIPVGAVCASSLLTKKCIVGDTKSYAPPTIGG